jgi:hypothetical protein
VALTREQILARKVAGITEPFKIDNDEVIIRGLTRNEALAIRAAETDGERDNLMISFGLVDPPMTPEDVDAWGAGDDAGTMIRLSNRISELSNMVEGAGKSGVSRTRKRS